MVSETERMLRELAETGDERFKPLRGEHDFGPDGSYDACQICGWNRHEWLKRFGSVAEIPPDPYCLRLDGDALDECIANCGYSVRVMRQNEEWLAVLDNRIPHEFYQGQSSREAKLRALTEAVTGGQ